MEEKRLVSIFKNLAVFILLLDIILIAISFFLRIKKGYSDELKDNILNYIKLHNLREFHYNFHKIFWCSTIESPSFLSCSSRFTENFLILCIYLIYLGISIIGFIFYLIFLCKKHICLLITSIIFYLGVIPTLNLIKGIGFNYYDYYKLREYDLNDFGELNNDIEKMNNSLLRRMLIIKIASIILCISPFYYIISLFVFVIFKCLKKRSEHEEENRINSNLDNDKNENYLNEILLNENNY